MDTISLPPGKSVLQGYVFLSDPEGLEVFIIERDGMVWKQHPQLVFYLNKQVRPEIWNWHELLPGDAAWSFPEPGFPELELRGEDKVLTFICAGKELWCRCGDVVRDVGSGRCVPLEKYENLKASMRPFWQSEMRPFEREWGSPLLRAAVLNSVMFCRMALTGVEPHYGAGFYGLE